MKSITLSEKSKKVSGSLQFRVENFRAFELMSGFNDVIDTIVLKDDQVGEFCRAQFMFVSIAAELIVFTVLLTKGEGMTEEAEKMWKYGVAAVDFNINDVFKDEVVLTLPFGAGDHQDASFIVPETMKDHQPMIITCQVALRFFSYSLTDLPEPEELVRVVEMDEPSKGNGLKTAE